METVDLDLRNQQILALLRENARLSYSEIGTRLGISRTAAQKRIERMEQQGIIQGYQVVLNPQMAPNRMAFVVNVETLPECFEGCKEALAQARETVTVVQTTGNCHLLAICAAPDVPTMKQFVTYVYKTIPGIQSINAHSVLDEIKGSILPS